MLIGSVSMIKLDATSDNPERKVELILNVYKRYQDAIRSDSVATTSPDGILGARYVSIRGGFKGAAVPPDGEIPFVAAKEISFTDMLKSAVKLGNCLRDEKTSTESGKQVSPEVASKPHP